MSYLYSCVENWIVSGIERIDVYLYIIYGLFLLSTFP